MIKKKNAHMRYIFIIFTQFIYSTSLFCMEDYKEASLDSPHALEIAETPLIPVQHVTYEHYYSKLSKLTTLINELKREYAHLKGENKPKEQTLFISLVGNHVDFEVYRYKYSKLAKTASDLAYEIACLKGEIPSDSDEDKDEDEDEKGY